jgi:hypothetical protein
MGTGGGKAYGWTEVFLEVYYYECRFECWFRHYGGVVDVDKTAGYLVGW